MDFTEATDNPLNTPGARQLTAWTLRLADNPLFGVMLIADPHVFALVYASCAAAVEPPEELKPKEGMKKSATSENENFLATLKDLQRHLGDRITGHFARLYGQGVAIHSEATSDPERFAAAAKAWRKSADAEVNAVQTSQEQNIDRVAPLLDLADVERDLLLFQLNRHRPGFAQLFDMLLHNDEIATMMLGVMLGASPQAVSSALEEESKLVRSGLLTVQKNPLRIHAPSPHLRSTLTEAAESDQEFRKRFIKPLETQSSTGSLARLEEHDRSILMAMLRQPVPTAAEHGLHALVYGPKSVDKRDMLARLLQAHEITGYQVVTKNVPAENLSAWVYIAQRYLEGENYEAVLVIDRADQALTARHVSIMSIFGFGDDDDAPADDEERSSDEGLTGATVRCVWLTDRASFLSERNLGRFLFHCEARPGSRADRRERITAVISEFELSKDLEHHLAKYSLLGEQQVRQAATLAQLLHSQPESRDQVIRRAVHQSQRALGRDHTEELRDSVTQYSLDNLNIAGRFTPHHILAALRKRQKGTICMYGLPGAGKTQLAEYLAVELDLPIVMKRASDLLSKWVGDNEKNIAAMFDEAVTEGAILFLDEADSFLRDRSLARAEWSVTQVNELLQQMERHEGVFIAATNLMRDVDAAALRRFTFKLEFLPLKPEQSWAMFLAETDYDPTQATPLAVEDMQSRLWAISNLTPGDFATIKRQANMLDEHLTPDAWLEQLETEAKAKMLGIERNKLGFGG